MSRPLTKPKTFQASIRLEVSLAERADRLAERLATSRPDMRAFGVSRAATLRLAMLRGLDALESEADQAEATKTSTPRRERARGNRQVE
jgi:predicted transcriptional regulator